MNSVTPPLVGLPFFVAVAIMMMTVAVHVAFALGVGADAGRLHRSGYRPAFAGAFWWMIATLLGGIFVAAAYWLIHHSTLNPSLPIGEKRISEPLTSDFHVSYDESGNVE
jgi:hypothetical protein